jgi:hypothetical protein
MGVCNCMGRNKFNERKGKRETDCNKKLLNDLSTIDKIDKKKSYDYLVWPHKKVKFKFN